MNRNAIVVGVCGAFVAAVALAVALAARRDVAGLASAPRAKDPAVERLEAKLDALAGEVAALRKERGNAGERVAALGQALDAARKTLDEQAAAIAALRSRPAAAAPAPAVPDEDAAARKAEKQAAARQEFEELRKKVFGGSATRDEQQRFWELARTTGALAELVQELSGKVEQAPADVNARLQLAQAYLAKLLSVPEGPERGVWAMKAEEQWQKVIEQDRENWEARFSLAVSWSYWPEQFNKTPDAIKQFEILREQQTRMQPESGQAQVYLQLSLLYRRMGNLDKAKQALEEGRARHPDDESIKKALETTVR